MKRYKFDIYSTRLLHDITTGEAGYVLINPQNSDPRGTTILTKKVFAIRKDLYLFSNLKQVRRYLFLTSSKLYILGIKKIGYGFSEKDFILDFSRLMSNDFIGFNILYIKKDDLIKNNNYVSFLNIDINFLEISIDSFLNKKEEYYLGEENSGFGNKSISNKEIKAEKIDLIDDINLLEKELKFAIESEKFEKAAKIRDRIKKIKEKNEK